MEWNKAIEESKKGTAFRIHKENVENINANRKITIIRYKNGTAYRLVSELGKVNFVLSGGAKDYEINGFTDWKPSE